MTGDQQDILARLKALLPDGWFGPGPTPVLDALLSGPAWALSQIYTLIAYARLQLRIATATDGWLDRIALDYFGARIRRRLSQSDDSFRAIIQANLLPQANTRQAIISVLQRLTGRTPILLEPWNTGDTGVWDGPGFYWDAEGAWGESIAIAPCQGFVTAFRPHLLANSDLAGWDVPTGGWDAGHFYWADELIGGVSDADIIAAVESVRTGNTRIWLQIQS